MSDRTPPQPAKPTRYAPAIPLPPYSYVSGHDLPHPVNDPRGHSYNTQKDAVREPAISSDVLLSLPTDALFRRLVLAATLATNPRWLYAIDLFNAGFYWEAHEAWEGFWNALGRSPPEAQFVQGLIHLAAAAVKIREGKRNGVARHTERARELLGDLEAAPVGHALTGISIGLGETPGYAAVTLGLAPDSLAAVVAELEAYQPECWHTSRASVVRVLAGNLRLAE